MSEIARHLHKSISSINEHSEEKQKIIKDKYYKSNQAVIDSYLGCYERNYKLRNRSIFSCFNHEKRDLFESPLVTTRFVFGNKEFKIPIEFVALMESIARKKSRMKGVFRKTPNLKKIHECEGIFYDSLQRKEPLEEIIQKLDQFDEIILSGMFKGLFSRHVISIYPQYFYTTILKVMTIENPEHKMILSKYLIYVMPIDNRALLESILCFLLVIHDIDSRDGINYEGFLDLRGFGTIIMPNLFLGVENIFTFRDLQDLAEYSGYLLMNIKKFLEAKE